MVREAHSAEALLDVGAVLVGGLHLGVVEHVVHAGGVGVVGLDAVLHVDRAQLGGEALQGAVGNGDHERGLARAVGAHQAVLAPLLQVQARLVEQHARGEGQGELVVAQVLLIVVVVLLRLLHHHEAHNHLVDHSGGLVGGDELSQVGQQVGCPVGRVVVLAVHQVVRNDRHVGNHILVTGDGVGVLENDLGHLGLHLLHSHHGLLLLQGVTHDTVQGSKRPLTGVADLLNGHFVNAALEHGLNDGIEDSSVTRVIDQLAHAVNNHSRSSLHDGLALSEGPQQEGHNDTQGALAHSVDECGGEELVQRLDSLSDGLGVGLEQHRDQSLDIDVADGGAHTVEGLGGGVLHLPLGVLHSDRELAHNVKHVEANLSRVKLGIVGNEKGAASLVLEVLGLLQTSKEHLQEGLGHLRVHKREEGLASRGDSISDLSLLVAKEGDQRGQRADEQRLKPPSLLAEQGVESGKETRRTSLGSSGHGIDKARELDTSDTNRLDNVDHVLGSAQLHKLLQVAPRSSLSGLLDALSTEGTGDHGEERHDHVDDPGIGTLAQNAKVRKGSSLGVGVEGSLDHLDQAKGGRIVSTEVVDHLGDSAHVSVRSGEELGDKGGTSLLGSIIGADIGGDRREEVHHERLSPLLAVLCQGLVSLESTSTLGVGQ
mmetsp:Transcript_19477/g.43238  ORF Transcript_19477/g.43238 Transcript_19477/m.43238 type:complete len:656 (-) Transcript_19477:351-2318(-)